MDGLNRRALVEALAAEFNELPDIDKVNGPVFDGQTNALLCSVDLKDRNEYVQAKAYFERCVITLSQNSHIGDNELKSRYCKLAVEAIDRLLLSK